VKPEAYAAFTEALVRSLSADPRVIGLVAAGSMAQTDHAPDVWSDHDFWIVTVPGAQEHFRTVYDWLPDSARLVLAFRETAHGLKLLYDTGHLIEYAVFDEAELDVVRINSYRLLLDRANLAARLAAIQTRTMDEATQRAERADSYLFGQFLTNLLVGVGRHARGEHLSGHDFVRRQAVGHLLPLLIKYTPASRPDQLDNLDPLRRFEFAFPALGEQLDAALALHTPSAADALRDIADSALRAHLDDYPAAAVAAVRGTIALAAAL